MKSIQKTRASSAPGSRTAEEWFAIVNDMRAAGLTAKAYAARHGYVRSTLAWWSSELSRRERTGERIEDVTTRSISNSEAFLPVVVTPSRTTSTIAIEFGSVTIRMASGTGITDVVALVRALDAEAPC